MTPSHDKDVETIDRRVRAAVYELTVLTGAVPQEAALHDKLGMQLDEVRASLVRLNESHRLTLEPNTTRIWMAHPFSAVPTGFSVFVNGLQYFANCAWDVFGIASLLQSEVSVRATCGDCGEQLEFNVCDDVVRRDDLFVHFLVPPRRFYDDIGFT